MRTWDQWQAEAARQLGGGAAHDRECRNCGHAYAAHRGEPFTISSQGCAVWGCTCVQPGPALARCSDFVVPARAS